MKTLNIVGRRIQRFRNAKQWSQNMFAAKLQLAGLDKSRSGVGRIESQIVHVRDYELLYFAKVLGIGLLDLFPGIDPAGKIHDVVTELMKPRKSSASARRRKKSRGRKSSRR
jgi:transcriptional regulator with XRE-family HTH domain